VADVARQEYPTALLLMEFVDPEGILPVGDRDELDDDVAHMLAGDAAELIENHWRVKATVVRGFDRLEALARQILDEVYPASVFGDADDPDSDASDPGVRLVRALRACSRARREGTAAS
jgi:hypothetical protein